MKMTHPAIRAGNVAVVTGGAAGIGLAIAMRLAKKDLDVAIVDLAEEWLTSAETALKAAGAGRVLAIRADVSDPGRMADVAQQVEEALGGADLVFANAGIQPGSALFGPEEAWQRVLDVNLWGIIRTARAFAPGMIARGRAGAIVCTGSKQGITTPPGDPAYNVAKSGVKVFAEALAHELRNTEDCAITAHLLIPGFVFTELTRHGRNEKPDGAWTPEETSEFTLERMAAGDFYILCPDNDVPRALDEKRIAWAAGDIIENRPALSRWHPDWVDRFERYVKV